MLLEKSSELNDTNRCILSSNIFEYDMAHAAASVIKIIKGDELYNRLLKMPKEERNIQIGLMIRDDKSLGNYIEKQLILWRNEFISLNNIKKENIIETTKDSVLFKNVIPKILKLPQREWVEFRIKDKDEYSSYIRIDDRLRILYDGLKKYIKIKGIKDETVNKSLFVKKILIPLVQALENNVSLGYIKSYKNIQICRINYINSNDVDIYRELLHNNQLLYKKYNNEVYSDNVIDGEEEFIDKGSNYVNIMMPLFKIII